LPITFFIFAFRFLIFHRRGAEPFVNLRVIITSELVSYELKKFSLSFAKFSQSFAEGKHDPYSAKLCASSARLCVKKTGEFVNW